MKTLFIGVLLLCQIVVAQEEKKIETYQFGHDGIELIVKLEKSSVIISTFNAKMSIKHEIAQKIYAMHKEGLLKDKETHIIKGDEAIVTGYCTIKKVDNLTSIEFHYDKVDWNSGLTELYAKSKNIHFSRAVADSD